MRNFVLGLWVCVGLFGPVCARAAESPGCDPEFEKVLDKQAWMQAQREVEFSETLITKPGSVLQYTCFDNVAGQTEDLWTKDSKGVTQAPMKAYSKSVTQAPMKTYLKSNFKGGVCASMADIWKASKCPDFDKNSFKPLEKWAAADPRKESEPCNAAQRDKDWKEALKTAHPPPGEKGGVDKVMTYNGAMMGGDCSKSSLVSTGEFKIKPDKTMAPVYTCSTPGCSYIDGVCK